MDKGTAKIGLGWVGKGLLENIIVIGGDACNTDYVLFILPLPTTL